MQRPWMANQDVTDLQRDWLHFNLAGLDCPKRAHSRHAMSTWRNFNRAVLLRDLDQAKTDNQRVRREHKIRSFWKERMLIVHMHSLMLRSMQGHIAAPLVGDDAVIHQPADDGQNCIVEEEFWSENR